MKLDFLKGRERMILALLGGIIFMLVQVFVPSMKLDENQSLMFIGLLGAYIVGEGVSVQQLGQGFKDLFKSQKFQALLAGLIVIILQGVFPDIKISEEQVIGIISLLGTFILSAGIKS
jgi:zinc transporter ZupT